MSGLYEYLCQWCKDTGESLNALCQRAGVSRSTVQSLKTGSTKTLSSATIVRFADAMGVDSLRLFELSLNAPGFARQTALRAVNEMLTRKQASVVLTPQGLRVDGAGHSSQRVAVRRRLSVRQLRALPIGSWVWISLLSGRDRDNGRSSGYYRRMDGESSEDIYWAGYPGTAYGFLYSDYGKTWASYPTCPTPLCCGEEA